MMTPKDLPHDFKNSISRLMQLFQIVGLDIYDDSNYGMLKKHGKFIFFMITFIVLTVCEIVFLVTGKDNGATFEELADAVPCGLILMQDVTLLVVFACRRNEIREVIFEIAEMWPKERSLDKEQRYILKTWLGRLKIYENSYLTMIIIICFYFMIFPLSLTLYVLLTSQQEVYHYPYHIYNPFKVDSMPRYLLSYAFQAIFSSCLHLCTHISSILLLAAITVDISVLLRLLQHDLENAVQECSLSQRDYGDTHQHNRNIKNIVETHQKLLRLTEKVNKTFGIIVLVPVCLTSIILAFFGFIATIADRAQMTRTLMGLIGVLFEIFNLSWPGQILADTSSGIAVAAYASLWYNSDVKFRKSILNIMFRSQKPCYISSLGYMNMTLHTFTTILSTSWSYLSLLLQVYQKNEN